MQSNLRNQGKLQILYKWYESIKSDAQVVLHYGPTLIGGLINLSYSNGSLPLYLATLGLLFLKVGNFWSSHWYIKWLYVLCVFVTWQCYQISKRYSYWIGAFLLMACLSALSVFAWDRHPFIAEYGLLSYPSIAKNCAYSFICVLASINTLLLLDVKFMPTIKRCLQIIFWISLIKTFTQYHKVPYWRAAFSGNASMNGCLLACLMPYALASFKNYKLQLATISLTTIGVYMTGASVPIGTLAVVLSCLYIKQKKHILYGAIGLSVAFGISLMIVPDFLANSGRFGQWTSIMGYWWENYNHFIGTGWGTGVSILSQIQLEILQKANPIRKYLDGYMWLHNDWLQMIFEIGFIGFVLFLGSFVITVLKSLKDRYLFATLIGFGACAVFNYPLRLPIHAVAVTLTVWLIFNQRKGELTNG